MLTELRVSDWDAYRRDTLDVITKVQREVVYSRGFRPGDGATALFLVIAGQLEALGIDNESLTGEERSFLQWLSFGDQPTIAAFLTVVRRLAQDGHPPVTTP